MNLTEHNTDFQTFLWILTLALISIGAILNIFMGLCLMFDKPLTTDLNTLKWITVLLSLTLGTTELVLVYVVVKHL